MSKNPASPVNAILVPSGFHVTLEIPAPAEYRFMTDRDLLDITITTPSSPRDAMNYPSRRIATEITAPLCN